VNRWEDLDGGVTILRLWDIIMNKGFWIINGWRYKSGDDSTWAKPELDDSAWEIVSSRMNTDNLPPDGWKGNGWFRLHLDVDSSLWNYPLAFNLYQIGGSEVFLDGKPLYTFGVVGHSDETEQPSEDRNPKIISFGPSRTHVLAVRYSNFSKEKFARVGIYAGFEILLGNPNDAIANRIRNVRQTSILQMVFTTISIVLALLHFFLFLFYPKSRENLYYALCMIGFAGITFCINQSGLTTSALQILTLNSTGIVSQMLAVVAGLLLFHTLVYGKIPLHGFVAVGIGVALSVWAFLLPDKTMNTFKDVFTVVALAEILVGYFRTGQRTLEGASIMGIGFIILAITVVYEVLAGNGIIPTVAGIRGTYVYGALALSISMSIFLSRRFAHTNQQLEIQLQQVRDLSERTLEQERRARNIEIERRLLEADNQRKTLELEDARAFQLSLLPQQVPHHPSFEIAAMSIPATEVGGDYYDFAHNDDGVLTAVIGDATGHGAKAGTMVAVTKGLFHELAHLPDINDILVRCNKAIKGMNLGQVYMGMTIIRLQGNEMTAAIAGMPPVLVYRARTREVEHVTLKGMPLGAFSDFPFQWKIMKLDTNDVVVLLSDGYTERFNNQRETLDLPRAMTVLKENGLKAPHEIIEVFMRDAEEWANGVNQADDVTLVVIKKR
jgi:serine phosphatase RsbU (regulator of sigma subunit)